MGRKDCWGCEGRNRKANEELTVGAQVGDDGSSSGGDEERGRLWICCENGANRYQGELRSFWCALLDGEECRTSCVAHQCPCVCLCVHVTYLCQPSFPECPERLHAIKEQLIQEGLLDRCVSFQVGSLASTLGGGQELAGAGFGPHLSPLFLVSPQARFAEKEELMLVHR